MNDRPIIRMGSGFDEEYESFVQTTVEWLEGACMADPRRGLKAIVSVLATMANDASDPAVFLTLVANGALKAVTDVRARTHQQSEGKPS